MVAIVARPTTGWQAELVRRDPAANAVASWQPVRPRRDPAAGARQSRQRPAPARTPDAALRPRRLVWCHVIGRSSYDVSAAATAAAARRSERGNSAKITSNSLPQSGQRRVHAGTGSTSAGAASAGSASAAAASVSRLMLSKRRQHARFACFWTAALFRRFCFWLLRARQRSAASDEADISKESGGKAPHSKSADPEDVFGAARVSKRGLARLLWRACPRFETTSLNRHPVLATTNHEKYRRSQTADPGNRPEKTARMKILEFSSPLTVQPLTRLAIDGFGSLLLVHQPSA